MIWSITNKELFNAIVGNVARDRQTGSELLLQHWLSSLAGESANHHGGTNLRYLFSGRAVFAFDLRSPFFEY